MLRYLILSSGLFAKEANEMQLIMNVIGCIRNIRGEHNVQPGKTISVKLRVHGQEALKTIEHGKKYIASLAKVGELSIIQSGEAVKDCATAVAGPVDIFVPFAGMINLDDEKARLVKEIARVEKYITAQTQKLENKNFAERAPKDIIAKERVRLEESKVEFNKLKKALDELA